MIIFYHTDIFHSLFHHTRYFILEFCCGSLNQVFLPPNNPKKYNGPKLPHYIDVLLQLASGLEYVHSKLFIHQDVKPENILLSRDSSTGTITFKWAGFGFSRSLNHSETCNARISLGTLNWKAPELLNELQDLLKAHALELREVTELSGTIESDNFALGLVFSYYLNEGRHPYGCTSWEIQLNIITKRATDVIGSSLKLI